VSNKTLILDFILDQLRRIDGSTITSAWLGRTVDGIPQTSYTFQNRVAQVSRNYRYYQQVNDFPAIFLLAGENTTTHKGANERYSTQELTLRCYVKTENSIQQLEDLIEDVEAVLNIAKQPGLRQGLDIVECRVTSIETDEGLFDPLGIANIRVLLVTRTSGPLISLYADVINIFVDSVEWSVDQTL
jgi:hypothetical protein